MFVVNLSNPTNAVLSKAVGEGWILNNDDRTYTAVADEEPNEIILTVGEAATSLRDGDVELFDGPQANPLALAITGEDEADDTFIVDFAENTFRSDIVTFDGGSDGMDAVEAESGDFASVTHTLVSPTDGSTVFVPLADLEDADENFTLNSTGIESYLLNVGTVEALILELPAFVTDAIIGFFSDKVHNPFKIRLLPNGYHHRHKFIFRKMVT